LKVYENYVFAALQSLYWRRFPIVQVTRFKEDAVQVLDKIKHYYERHAIDYPFRWAVVADWIVYHLANEQWMLANINIQRCMFVRLEDAENWAMDLTDEEIEKRGYQRKLNETQGIKMTGTTNEYGRILKFRGGGKS
jgi:hypothetical protein